MYNGWRLKVWSCGGAWDVFWEVVAWGEGVECGAGALKSSAV